MVTEAISAATPTRKAALNLRGRSMAPAWCFSDSHQYPKTPRTFTQESYAGLSPRLVTELPGGDLSSRTGDLPPIRVLLPIRTSNIHSG